jgi:hypothetical protein
MRAPSPLSKAYLSSTQTQRKINPSVIVSLDEQVMGHLATAASHLHRQNAFGARLVISAIYILAAAGAVAGQLDQTANVGGTHDAWTVARSRDPAGGPDAISIMRTAEMTRSDPDIAGLTLRCAENGVEVLVIVIEPQPPRSRPRVSLNAMRSSVTYEATVVPPFSALLLPREASALLIDQWKVAPELSIQVDSEGAVARGVVVMTGFQVALGRLTANCVTR